MADMELELLVQLKNAVAGPAREIVSSLKAIQEQMGGIDDSLESQNSDWTQLASGIDDSLESQNSDWTQLASGIEGAAVSAAKFGAALGAAAIGAGIAGLGEFFRYTTASAMFLESTLSTMSILLESDWAAKEFLGTLTKLAAVTPFETKEIVGFGKQLLGAGFNAIEIPVLLKTAGDLASVSSSLMSRPEIVSHLLMYINKMKTIGELTGEVVQGIGDFGLPVQAFLQQIQKQTGLPSIEAVKKAIEGRKIGSEMAITALIDTSIGIFGGLGKGMDKASRTLEGILSTLTSKPFEWAMNAADSEGYQAVKKMIEDLNTVLDQRTPGIIRRVNELYSFMAKTMFGSMDSSAIVTSIDGILSAFDRYFAYVQVIVPAVKGFMGGLAEGLGWKLPDQLSAEQIAKMAEEWGKAAAHAGNFVGQIVLAVNSMGELMSGTSMLKSITSPSSSPSSWITGAVSSVPIIGPLLGAISETPTAQGVLTGGQKNITVTIPQTITVNGSADAQAVADAAREGAEKARPSEWWNDNFVEIGYAR